jgi:hypothetical protein
MVGSTQEVVGAGFEGTFIAGGTGEPAVFAGQVGFNSRIVTTTTGCGLSGVESTGTVANALFSAAVGQALALNGTLDGGTFVQGGLTTVLSVRVSYCVSLLSVIQRCASGVPMTVVLQRFPGPAGGYSVLGPAAGVG